VLIMEGSESLLAKYSMHLAYCTAIPCLTELPMVLSKDMQDNYDPLVINGSSSDSCERGAHL
jgi:hypothetical protein